MEITVGCKVVVIDRDCFCFGWEGEVEQILIDDDISGPIQVVFPFRNDWPPPECRHAKCGVRFVPEELRIVNVVN